MIYLAPTLTASHYLDQTEQWSKLPPETKDHAVDLIQKGSGFRESRSQSQGGTREGSRPVTSPPLLSQATCASSSFGRKMAPLGLGYTGTAAPGEAWECIQGSQANRASSLVSSRPSSPLGSQHLC